MLQAGQRALGYWPALQLLVEIELEVGSQDSHLRALNRLQTFCDSMQAMLEEASAASSAGSKRVWYQPVSWLRGWRQGEDPKVSLPGASYTSLAGMMRVDASKISLLLKAQQAGYIPAQCPPGWLCLCLLPCSVCCYAVGLGSLKGLRLHAWGSAS